MNKNALMFGFVILMFGLILYGCGQQLSSSSGTGSSYTISGQVPNSQATSQGIGAKATTVTHIVAIGANNVKTLATLSSDGSFTIPVTTGWPYVIGFFNKSGSTITLLGYLRQSEVDWDSLPLMNPSSSATDLGTVTVDSTSVEATPSIDLTSLINQMNMDLSTANLYGAVDDPLTALTNLDMDGNGTFDFQENKAYLFQTYIGMQPSGSYITGEIAKMLAGYNETYSPSPGYYQFVLAVQGDSQSSGTAATLTAPEILTSAGGGQSITNTATVAADSSGTGWVIFFRLNDSSITAPATAPSGTYTMAVGSSTYTVSNFKASDVVAVNSNNNIIYPVFHLVTNEAGYITTVQYKWKKLTNGSIGDASAAEVQAAIEDTSLENTFVHTSPFISFFQDANTLYGSIIKFDRDGSSVDVSSLNIKPSDVHHIQASYNLTSRVVCKFDLQ